MTQHRDRVLFRLLAVLLGLLAGGAATELGLRLFEIHPRRYPPPRWLAFDGTTFRRSDMWGQGRIKRPSRFPEIEMGEYVPGARFRVEYADNPRGYFDTQNGVEMQVNSLGLRGPTIEREKPTGTRRLLGLGDSFTFGVGVREADTFLRRLESRLTDRAPCQVLNAGTQGYNTRDEQLYLEHHWLEFSPDAVLVVFYLNDVYRDEAAVSFWNNGEGDGVYLRPSGLATTSLLADWCQHQWRTHTLRQQMSRHYNQGYFTNPRAFFSEVRPSGDMDWPAARKALERMVTLGRERGFRVGLTIFPELFSLDDDYPFAQIHRFVAAECQQLGLPVHDLLPAFLGHRDEDLWVHPTDHHPNEEAHRIAAEALVTFVRSELLAAQDSATGSPGTIRPPR